MRTIIKSRIASHMYLPKQAGPFRTFSTNRRRESRKHITSELLLIVAALAINCYSYAQPKGSRTYLGEESAKNRLEQSLADSTLHNVVDYKKELIKDKEAAVAIAEQFLFSIYGQTNIEEQRPYEIYKMKNYWSISGTLSPGSLGGTFFIILDARNGAAIRITHGK